MSKETPSRSCVRFIYSNATIVIVFIQILLLCRSTKCLFDVAVQVNDLILPPNPSSERTDSAGLLLGTLHSSYSEHNESPLLPVDELPSSSAPRKKSRLLIGLMAAESPDLNDYARVHRELFALHPNVCSLKHYQETRSPVCEILYTFVFGANEDGPTEIVNDTLPILAFNSSHGLVGDDVTHLNIRENMNDGKSQTWFYYASTLADDLGVDYVGKIDLDTMLYLDKLFAFKEMHLPPSPYNKYILVGQFVDKDLWNVDLHGKRFPGKFWEKEKLVLGNLSPSYHMYAQGGCYIMSTDLVSGVVRVANTVPKKNYFEQHEDHDVSTMAFISTVIEGDPNYAATMSLKQMTTRSLFWRHPIKREHRKWDGYWKQEMLRMGKIVRDLAS